MSFRTCCSKRFSIVVALLAMFIVAAPAVAQTCLQNEYNLVNKQKLNCTANDVRIAQVTNIRDPLTGNKLSSCIAGSNFNFLADFEILTTSSSNRENIGMYIATNSTTTALTGACVDNIISPTHPCPSNSSLSCGSNNYHESDPAPDNCGDTSSSDGGGTGIEIVTLEIDNFACNPPAGQNTLVLPNCTSWQIPGGTIQCVSSAPSYPYPFNGPGGTPTAIPGSPSKCNCSVIPLPITVQTPNISVAKACTTANSPGTNTSCTLLPEGGVVTYTVDMNNNQSNFGSVVIDQICDSQYGTVYTDGTLAACAPGTQGSGLITGTNCTDFTIAFGADQKCTFTVNQPENVTITDTVNVSGHGTSAGKFGPDTTNSVTVVSHEAASSATVTKGFVGTEAACATVRYSVDVANTSAAGTDETESLTALNDNAFGSITSVQGSVLGTTCGVATGSAGLGTLSGSTGAGVLPASLPVGGPDYTCQFDGQFCSAVDINGCISHTNSVGGTITGDEGDTVTQSDSTLTVKECLSATITSTGP